jgi:hypothetical protein
MTKRTKIFCLILAVVAVVWVHGLLSDTDTDTSFHPNGTTILTGAIVCPDSVGARSEFHKGIQEDKAMRQLVPHGDPTSDLKFLAASLEIMKTYKTDFSPYGCSEFGAGEPVSIESEDAGIATIAVELKHTLKGDSAVDDTLLHGITYASEVQSVAPGQ